MDNNKSNISSIADLILTKPLLEGFLDKATTPSLSSTASTTKKTKTPATNISQLLLINLILTKLERITITTETKILNYEF